MDIIRVENLSVGYGGVPVLRDMSFAVPAGEITAVIGKSGCGKSTLLKTLIGLTPPLSGEVTVSGVTIDFSSEASLQNLFGKIGVLYQNSALLNSLSLYDNVALPLRMHFRGLPAQVEEQMVTSRLAQVDLLHTQAKFPAELSGGMKKRGALARALVLSPDIIFCDEPSAGLDPLTSAEIDDLLLYLKQQLHMTVIVVTHELRSIERIADRVLALHEGRVHFWGRREEMFSLRNPFLDRFFLKVETNDH
ncbi:MAG: ATP-binding cassette domain-containing protein [Candidatus Aminicenantaceae bacterium]